MKKSQIRASILDVFIISTLIFLLIPLNLIANNAKEFAGFSYTEFFSYGILLGLMAGIVLFLVFFVTSLISPAARSKIATVLFGYLVVCGLYFSIRSGLMDGGADLKVSYVALFAVLIPLILAAIFFEKKLRVLIWIGLIGALVTTAFGLSSVESVKKQIKPDDRFFEVSTGAPNIFLISFDALQSDQVKRILDNNEELKENFEGFINFSHVASVAPFTVLSTLITKLGYVPETNIDTETFVQKSSEQFITPLLKSKGYQVSTYASFNYGEDESSISVHQGVLAPDKRNFYTFALYDSFQKYVPVRLTEVSSLAGKTIYLAGFFIKNPIEDIRYEAMSNDPNKKSHIKVDIFNFSAYVDNLVLVDAKKTAHLHHYGFTHPPMSFDANCNYRMVDSVSQNEDSSMQAAECALKEFSKFLEKLKALNVFNNSFIIFASDHGNECEYNSDFSFGSYKVSKRWCLSRYTPILIVKPFGLKKKFSENTFEASLLDINKTICQIITDETDSDLCSTYEGVNITNIKSDDKFKKRKILVTKQGALPNVREYDGFEIVNIGRDKTISQYFHLNENEILIYPKNLISNIDFEVVGTGKYAVANKSKKGVLTKGYGVNLPEGTYNLEMYYQSNASKNAQVGSIKVIRDKGKVNLKETSLKGTENQLVVLEIPFTLNSRAEEVEFVSLFNGTYDLFVEKYVLRKKL